MTPLNHSLVHIRVGDSILDIECGEPVTVRDFYVVPNGMIDPRLVCVIIARRANGNVFSATSDHFAALTDEVYETRYPSDMDEHVTKPRDPQ